MQQIVCEIVSIEEFLANPFGRNYICRKIFLPNNFLILFLLQNYCLNLFLCKIFAKIVYYAKFLLKLFIPDWQELKNAWTVPKNMRGTARWKVGFFNKLKTKWKYADCSILVNSSIIRQLSSMSECGYILCVYIHISLSWWCNHYKSSLKLKIFERPIFNF